MKQLEPIPVPPAQRWLEFKARTMPALIFTATMACAAVLWGNYIEPTNLVGRLQVMQANVASPKPGALVQLNLNLQQEVKAGDVVGQVVTTDPKIVAASLAVIQAEINLLRADLSPSLGIQRFELNLEHLRIDWLEQKVTLATSRADLLLAEAQLRRTAELFRDKISAQADLDVATARRDSLQANIKEREVLITQLEGMMKNLSLGATNEAGQKLDPVKAAINVQVEKLRLTEAEMNPVPLRAPLTGKVSAIFKHSGETILAGEPLITVTATHTEKIIAYALQPLRQMPEAGMEVRVRTRSGQRLTGVGKVLDVGAAVETLPATYKPPGAPVEAGIPMVINLPPNLHAVPGELVDLTLLPKNN